MSGPADLTEPELTRCGLGAIQRRAPSGQTVTRIYCLRCGSQIPADRRDADPGGWWACARGCNTRYADAGAIPRSRPTT
jgi:hypothetical protein